MAVVRVDVREHYGSGEIWTDAGNETAALQDAREWCEAHPPWELHTPVPDRGDDGHYRFKVERAFSPVE